MVETLGKDFHIQRVHLNPLLRFCAKAHLFQAYFVRVLLNEFGRMVRQSDCSPLIGSWITPE